MEVGHVERGNRRPDESNLYAPSIAPKTAPLLVVLGPTGTGRSSLALQLAQAFDGEIINCDSVQVYRGLEIGSAKLPPRERGGIRTI